jgi:hypothetical protein
MTRDARSRGDVRRRTITGTGPAPSRVEAGRTVGNLLADDVDEHPVALVDTAMSCARSSHLPADTGITTLEPKTNSVRAVTQATGRVDAEGTVVPSGRRVATTETRVREPNGTRSAHATSTCLILRGKR